MYYLQCPKHCLSKLLVAYRGEGIGSNEQQEVLRLEVALGDKPIQPKDNRQKKQKLRAVEEHDSECP